MKRIDSDMVLLIHQLIAEESGGSVGLRDRNLLESALENVFVTFDGKDLYPTKIEKGARLGFNLVANHALIDGNKRIGTHVMLTVLAMNGIELEYTQSVSRSIIISVL